MIKGLISLSKVLFLSSLLALSAAPGGEQSGNGPDAPRGERSSGNSVGSRQIAGGTVPFWAMQSRWADSLLASMSTDEKIGQLLMVAAYSSPDKDNEDQLRSLIRNQHIGGLIWFQGSPLRQVNRTNRLQAQSRIPLLIGMDAEWGPSMRLDSTVVYPRQLSLGAIQDDRSVYEFGKEAARQLQALGVHISFSPVVDVNNNPLNPVIGDRSFGEDPMNVALKGLAYMEGLQQNGVLACGKHFPGHGDTDADSHHQLPVIDHPWTRLDSLELYPFRVLMSQGLASVMTAHLHIPSLDNRRNSAASVSPAITTGLLRDSLGFGGLAITDALNMKGVSANFPAGELEVTAFLAGNDILLFPQDVPAAQKALRKAVEEGRISTTALDERVLRILKAKAWAGLDHYKPTPTAGLSRTLNDDQAQWIRRMIAEKRLTLLGASDSMLPFPSGSTPDVVLIDVGRNTASGFQAQCREFGDFPSYVVSDQNGATRYAEVLAKASAHRTCVVGLFGMNRQAREQYGLSASERGFLQQLAEKTQLIVVVFGSPYAAEWLPENAALLISYDEQSDGQHAAARALFGQVPVRGRMPVSSGARFPFGSGADLAATKLKPSVPEEEYFSRLYAERIDSIAERALHIGAAAGIRVLVARRGNIIIDRSYGLHTYPGQIQVKPDDLFDLASITKVAATTISIMRLYEQGKISLDGKVQDYLPEFANTKAGEMRIRDLMTHNARLQPWIPFYQYTLLPDKSLNPAYYRQKPDAVFNVPVAESVWMHKGWQDSIWRRIGNAPLLSSSQYKYSDLGFYLLGRMVERISGQPLDRYTQQEFYQPMGLVSTGFRPLERWPKQRIVPTERDIYYRNQLVHGYVHDMGAAMLGGVAGHAGLFSSAEELTAIFQMLLNGGSYGGHRFLQPETIALFTARQRSDSRRGLGFDKPEPDKKKVSPSSLYCSPSTYGHSGFTGTVVWADPEYDLVYVFLSNRIYPDQNNKLLISQNIRTKIQDEIYRGIRQGAWLPRPDYGDSDAINKP